MKYIVLFYDCETKNYTYFITECKELCEAFLIENALKIQDVSVYEGKELCFKL